MINLDERKVYVFVREDLPLGQDDIQSNHACYNAGMKFMAQQNGYVNLPTGNPYMVTIGCPTIKSLRKAQKKMDTAGIQYFIMTDTDVDSEPTAIATFPLERDNQVLTEYRLRCYDVTARKAGA